MASECGQPRRLEGARGENSRTRVALGGKSYSQAEIKVVRLFATQTVQGQNITLVRSNNHGAGPLLTAVGEVLA